MKPEYSGTVEIFISSSSSSTKNINNNNNEYKLADDDDEEDLDDTNSIIELIYNSSSSSNDDDETRHSFDISTNNMDPYYDYRKNSNINPNDHHPHPSTGSIPTNNNTNTVVNSSTTDKATESNPATDCSTILSECFSGEDTAEVAVVVSNATLVLDGDDSVPSIPPLQHIQEQREIVESGNAIHNAVVPSPVRYLANDPLDSRSSTERMVNAGTAASQLLSGAPMSPVLKSVYPKDPTTTPNRLLGSQRMIASSSPAATVTATAVAGSNNYRSIPSPMMTTKQMWNHHRPPPTNQILDRYSVVKTMSSQSITEPPSTNPSLHTVVDGDGGGNDVIVAATDSVVDQPQPQHLLPPVSVRTNDKYQENHNEDKNSDDKGDNDDDEEEELSWRMNPSKSMSDWTIEIIIRPRNTNHDNDNDSGGSVVTAAAATTTTTTAATIYHVHKSVLAVGPRRSQYFVKLFRSHPDTTNNHAATTTTTTSGTNMTTTQLEMDELTATAFPLLLDFLYGTVGPTNPTVTAAATTTKSVLMDIPITTYNATALHVLAQQFEMKQLRTIVRNFWMQDLSMDNMVVYYQHASTYKLYHATMRSMQNTSSKYHTTSFDTNNNNKNGGCTSGGLDDPLIIRALEMYCAQHMFDVDSGNCTIADILDLIDPQFLYHVIVLAHDNNQKYSMNRRSDNDENNCPINTFSLRLSLIIAVYCNIHYETDLNVAMFQQLTDENHLPILECQAAKAFLELQEKLLDLPNATVTSLTKRCITVLAKHWDDACIKKQDQNSETTSTSTTVILPRLEGTALETFVSQAFATATDRISEVDRRTVETQVENNRLHNTVEVAQSKIDTLDQQNTQLQLKIRELQKQMDEMTQQMSMTNRIQQQSFLNNNNNNTSCTMNKSGGGCIPDHSTSENILNGVVNVEYTDNKDYSASMIETNIRNNTNNTIRNTSSTIAMNDPYPPPAPFSQQPQEQQSPSQEQQRQLSPQPQQQRNAVDHGRLLLQRLDSPSAAARKTNTHLCTP